MNADMCHVRPVVELWLSSLALLLEMCQLVITK